MVPEKVGRECQILLTFSRSPAKTFWDLPFCHPRFHLVAFSLNLPELGKFFFLTTKRSQNPDISAPHMNGKTQRL